MIRVMCDDAGITKAAHAVAAGRTIVYPTDTVYALGCDPFNAEAVSAVYQIKRRDLTKKMPVLCASVADAWRLVDVSLDERRRVERFWPGALTIIAPIHDAKLKDTMMLVDDKIAVRVPAGKCVRLVLDACGPLVGTSANISGGKPALDADSVEPLDAEILVDGQTIEGAGVTSTVIELGETLKIIRKGAIRTEELDRVWI